MVHTEWNFFSCKEGRSCLICRKTNDELNPSQKDKHVFSLLRFLDFTQPHEITYVHISRNKMIERDKEELTGWRRERRSTQRAYLSNAQSYSGCPCLQALAVVPDPACQGHYGHGGGGAQSTIQLLNCEIIPLCCNTSYL